MTENKSMDSYVEIALLFVLGILAGVALKVEAGKMITIGFDDYKMKFSSGQYNINDLQKKINESSLPPEEGTPVQSTPDTEQENQQ